jgi:hypothetical protein
MRGYFGLGQLSATEKSDILNQHKSVYNGYQTMQPQVSNTQPLTVYDFAGDKEGLVVNNKGEVKRYTNMGINEQVEQKEVCDECGAMEMSEAECSECGGMMYEGECSECGYRGGEMDEETGHLDDIYKVRDLNLKKGDFDYVEGGGNDYGTFEGMHKGLYKEQDGEVDELGTHELKKGKKYKYKTPSFDDEVEFDFEVDDEEGGDKMYKFKGKDSMNHLMAGKGVESFVDYLDEQDEFVNYEDNFEDPDNEDDAVVGSDDMQIDSSEMYEDETDDKPYEKGNRGMKASRTRATFEPTPKETEILSKLFGEYGDDIPPIVIRYLRKLPRKVFTKRLVDLNLIDKSSLHKLDEQGGNSDDMDVDDVEPAYDFESDGPMAGGDVYPVNEYDEDMEQEYDQMESAWSEDIDEVDISGSQGIYGDMDPAYDFDSEGPGKAGPYQEFSYEGETDEQFLPAHSWKHMARQQAAKDKGEDFDPNEFDPSDYEDLDAMSSWEDIKNYFGDSDWSEIDEDIQESFHNQKNRIMEMMNRMKVM